MLEHWPQGFANWPPKFDGILFFSIGANTRPYCSAFITNFGQIEKFFFNVSLDSYCKALGVDFNFCTNRNAGFGLNIGPES